MGIMTNRNSRSSKLAFLLITFAVLTGSQLPAVGAEDDYTKQLRQTVANLDPAQLRQAAGQGDASAQTNLGLMFHLGEGVSEDKQEAVKWYRMAAEQGYAEAQWLLGYTYYEGEGVAKDDREAEKWTRLAAEQEHAWAQYFLGSLHFFGEYGLLVQGPLIEEGTPPPKLLVEAVKWFQRSAEQGIAPAQLILGGLYTLDIPGVLPKDYRQAVKWLRLAAEQGDAEAQLELGRMYDDDEEGLPTDYVKAYAWYVLAEAQGDANAVKAKDRLKTEMTAAQLTAAQSLAGELSKRIKTSKSE